ncbi:MAG: group II intron reverse transcriptase/maturase [Sphingobacteriales bacterium]|nr:MAG: group II intron reverse transcriptase/maturase [Sphingobacteriales bacterium]
MIGRKQKISQDTWLQKNRTESEGYAGGQTFMWITENNLASIETTGYGMLEYILCPANLNAAYTRVKRNRGAGGVDKMEVESLRDYLIREQDGLIASILDGTYRPNPVRRVEIPKEGAKSRPLGIPTVVDRVIQQAIAQVLGPVYEKQFCQHSYGFRPGRSAHQGLQQCQKYIGEGYVYAADLDLEKFFDTVNQSKLIEVLSRTIKDGRVISLIHRYLQAGVVVSNKFEQTDRGVPQGGPLSPLLSNIMLNELDKEITCRGHRFVRYADDMIILCRSERSAQRAMRSLLGYIEGKLFLRVNRDKSSVAHVSKVRFLGYSFYRLKGEGRLRVHPKSVVKMRSRIRELTSRSNGWGNERRKTALRQYIMGWVNYYKLADMKQILQETDEWYRRRIRMVVWKQWKRIRTRMSNLTKLGICRQKAWEFASTRKGYWRIANSPILSMSVTNQRLRTAGYLFLTDYYLKVRN